MFSNFLQKKFVDESVEEQKKDLKRFGQEFYSSAVGGKDCDSLFGDKQDFGHSIDNPIPVNGSVGEIKYLNRLRCKCGSGLMYHRLKSVFSSKTENMIDVYETVCVHGKHWDVLYFDFYHPRRSTWLPVGYKFSEFHPVFSKNIIGYGVNTFDDDFPFGLRQFIALQWGMELDEPFIKKFDEIIKDKSKFVRPEDHKIKLTFNL